MSRPLGIPAHNKQSIEEVKQRLFEVHGDIVSLKEETYSHMRKKCAFIDIEYGEWQAYPNNVISKGTQHPIRAEKARRKTWNSKDKNTIDEIIKKRKITNKERYGVEDIFNVPSVRDKTIKSKTIYKKKDFKIYNTTLEDFIDTKPQKGFGLIYRATSPKNKIYYGKTNRSLFVRIKQHIRDANLIKENGDFLYDSKFPRAIRKYTANKIKWEIIQYLPEKQLDMWERLWIFVDNTYKDGLNATEGGDGGSPMLGKKNSLETIRKRMASIQKYHKQRKQNTLQGGF